MSAKEAELRKQATALFKDNCLGDEIDTWVRLQLLKADYDAVLENSATLIREHSTALDTAIAAERERCAGIAEEHPAEAHNCSLYYDCGNEIAAAIREGKPQ